MPVKCDNDHRDGHHLLVRSSSIAWLRRFVTGDWAAAERRATVVPGAEGEDDDDDVYGDFEDIEAGLGKTGGFLEDVI